MTKLTIYRGESLISEVQLTGKTLRLGRSKDNDVVLEDPGKGVSRTHAELRPEGGRYRLVDLESQNGIWVSGVRVPSVLLAPGTVAAMGPFRVAIDATSPVTQGFTPITPELLPETGTEFSRPIPPTAPAGAAPMDGPGALLDDLSGSTAPAPATPLPSPSPKPAAPAAAAAPRPPRPAGTANWYSQPLVWIAVAVVLVAASGYGAYKFVYKAPRKPAFDVAAATTLASNNRCQEALDQYINPALQADPNNAEALGLKQRCTPPTTTSIPPTVVTEPAVVTKTAAQQLDDAETALAAKDCQTALEAAKTVLIDDPNDARAKDIAAKATTCLTPIAPKTATVGDPVVKIAPADGGLEPLPGESGKDYKIRVNLVRKRYDDAVGLLQVQRYSQALREFEAIAPNVPAGYRDLAQRRTEARNAIRDEATRAYNAGQQAEQRGELNVAIERYQRAHDLDAARDVTAEIARINEQKLRVGQQLCNAGMASFALGKNADALDKLTKAVELLPSSDACYVRAKDALTRIGR